MSERPKFYCAGAIRGKVFDKEYFDKIIKIVKEYGEPKTEKLGYKLYPMSLYANFKDRKSVEKLVAERDRKWIRQCRAVIAEFSGASTGTGWEICYATRVQRKPTLCLCHKSSVPSLMIKQDSCKYTIVQMYSDEQEFETYVRCFLETVTKLDKIDDIRKIYFKCQDMVSSDPDRHKIKTLVESMIERSIVKLPGVQGIWEQKMRDEYIVVPKVVDIDFKNPDQFIKFMFKNLILQKRWDCLKSQELGATFVGGRKPNIIRVLLPLQAPTNLLQIYRREGEDRIKYSREAFAKHVRALRRIGLLIGERVQAMRARSLVTVTQHLQHLSKFIDKFGHGPLVDFLLRSKRKDWYSDIPEIPVLNVDEITVADFYNEEWCRRVLENLRLEYDLFLSKLNIQLTDKL